MSPVVLEAARFRGRLAARILGLLGAASLAGQAAACWDGEVVLTGFGGGPVTDGGADGGDSGSRPAAASSVSTGGSTSTNPPACTTMFPAPTNMCFRWTSGSCPTDPWAVIKQLTCCSNDGTPCTTGSTCCPAGGMGYDPCAIVSTPTQTGEQCCYDTQAELCVAGGRPYLVAGTALVAAPVRGVDARGWVDGAPPSLAGLTPADRAALAAAWTADGLLEHASVASFARFALALLASGAPAALVRGAHRAALDEVAHARLCFGLASAYEGEVVMPGTFPVGGGGHQARHVPMDAGLSNASRLSCLSWLAVSTLEEGCIGETVAAVVAAEQLARATDPAVRAVLARIAVEESRHAELAWSTVAWAVSAGGSEVRTAVERVLLGLLDRAPRAAHPEDAAQDPAQHRAVMEAHGRLDPATVATVVAAAMTEVVAPAARALLRPELTYRSRRPDVSLTA
jgi:hypothetical protein